MTSDQSRPRTVERVLFTNDQDRWGWRLLVNGQVIATDGSQGYENEHDCRTMADRVINGFYRDARKMIVRPRT